MRGLNLLNLVAALLVAGSSASGRPDPEPGAIAAMLAGAKEGDRIIVPAGVYREHLKVDKRVSLIAEGRVVIDGGGSGDIVEITAPGVELRGFVVRNTGIDLDRENAAIRVLAAGVTVENNTLEDILFGIDVREGPGCIVRGNRVGGKALDIARRGDGIRLWRADGALVEGNTIHDGRDAIVWYSKGVTIKGNVSRRCRYGFHLMYCDEVTLEDNELTENSVGIYVMYSRVVRARGNHLVRNRGPSGYGIGLKEADRFTIEHNTLVGNRVGVYLDGSPFTTTEPSTIARNTIAYNDVGMTFLPSCRGNTLTENNFVDNIEQIAVGGRGALSNNSFSVGGRGNFWSDYTGYDEDGDGIGDFVHESQALFENLLDREPKLRLLLFSPSQQAVEFVGRAIPAVRPEPKFSDEYPLMRAVAGAAAAPRGERSSRALAPVAAAMLAVGVAVMVAARSGAVVARGRRLRVRGRFVIGDAS